MEYSNVSGRAGNTIEEVTEIRDYRHSEFNSEPVRLLTDHHTLIKYGDAESSLFSEASAQAGSA